MESRLIYCDTRVFMDYLGNRSDGLRPLGQFAFQSFQRTSHCEFDLVISDWLMSELREQGCVNALLPLLRRLEERGKIVFIRQTEQDTLEASRLPIHKADAIHVILAVRVGATCLVTDNIRDFYSCSDRIKIIAPNLV